jgi:hypothetical protein
MGKFEVGRSGNPKGRPKGARNLRTQFLEEVNAPESSEPEAGTKLQAAIKAQIGKALQGDIRAIRDVMERVEKWEAERHSSERTPKFTDADREVITEIHQRLALSSPASGGGAEHREAEGGSEATAPSAPPGHLPRPAGEEIVGSEES